MPILCPLEWEVHGDGNFVMLADAPSIKHTVGPQEIPVKLNICWENAELFPWSDFAAWPPQSLLLFLNPVL